MDQFDDELREIKREIVESRGLVIKTNNLTNSLAADIKARYRSASVLKNRRVVFNIKGNHYRLVVAIKYLFKAVYVRFVGTHAQYDEIDAEHV